MTSLVVILCLLLITLLVHRPDLVWLAIKGIGEALLGICELIGTFVDYKEWDESDLWRDYRPRNNASYHSSSHGLNVSAPHKKPPEPQQLSQVRTRGEKQMKTLSEDYLRKVRNITRS